MSDRAAQLHANPWRGVFYITGGGTELISEMLTTPGASRTVLEVTVPYAHAALTALLGRTPGQSCSAPTARAMAMAAFQRAHALGAAEGDDAHVFGFACTASLASDREKRGRHRAYIAVQTDWDTHFAEIALAGDRAEEEQQLVEALWGVLMATLHTSEILEHPFESVRADARWRDILLGNAPAVVTEEHDGGLLLSGSFNPLHHGHERMLDVAEQVTGRHGAYELSMVNPDKPPLDYHEVGARLAQFNEPVWLTRLPTFIEKAAHFPGTVFAVGIDTITRVDAVRYYADVRGRDAAIAELARYSCEFLVFGRVDDDQFVQLDDLELSPILRGICKAVPPYLFREDVSSTALRAQREEADLQSSLG